MGLPGLEKASTDHEKQEKSEARTSPQGLRRGQQALTWGRDHLNYGVFCQYLEHDALSLHLPIAREPCLASQKNQVSGVRLGAGCFCSRLLAQDIPGSRTLPEAFINTVLWCAHTLTAGGIWGTIILTTDHSDTCIPPFTVVRNLSWTSSFSTQV